MQTDAEAPVVVRSHHGCTCHNHSTQDNSDSYAVSTRCSSSHLAALILSLLSSYEKRLSMQTDAEEAVVVFSYHGCTCHNHSTRCNSGCHSDFTRCCSS